MEPRDDSGSDPGTILSILNHPKLTETSFFFRPTRKVSKDAKNAMDKMMASLLSFFSKHIDAMLEIIFEETPSNAGSRAYRILQHKDPILIDQITSSRRLQRYATKILHHIPIQPLCMARLCGLMLVAMQSDVNSIDRTCGFVFQLLPFIDEIAVFDMFEMLLGNAPQFKAAQEWLVSVNFSTVVLQEMRTVEPSDTKMQGFYRLLRRGKKSDTIFRHIANKHVISALVAKSEYWKDDRWESMASLYCEETKDPLRSQLMTAISVIQEDLPRVTRYQIAALTLLFMMVRDDCDIRPFFDVKLIAEICIKKMTKFSDNTFMQLAAERLVTQMLATDDMVPDIVPIIIPACMKYAGNRDDVTLSCTCFDILFAAKMREMKSPPTKKHLSKIDGWTKFSNTDLKRYVAFLSKPYGKSKKRLLPPWKNQGDNKSETCLEEKSEGQDVSEKSAWEDVTEMHPEEEAVVEVPTAEIEAEAEQKEEMVVLDSSQEPKEDFFGEGPDFDYSYYL